jgi:predicted  nucleic acid-binding Zn-ribbon protein
MGQLDAMKPQPVPTTWVEDLRERAGRLERELASARDELASTHDELASTRDELDDRSRHIANMEASVFWKLRDLVHQVLRRG